VPNGSPEQDCSAAAERERGYPRACSHPVKRGFFFDAIFG
jgi:hypothetical protein